MKQLGIEELIARYGKRKVLDMLALKSGYRCPVPTIQEFITDSEYIGGQIEFYPIWKEFLDVTYPNAYTSPYLELILTGAIGLGKSSVALAGIAYDICRMLCLQEPYKYFGLGKSKKLSFILMNTTKDVGRDVLYDQIMSWFSSSPFFRKHLAAAPKSSTFPKNIHVISGSRAGQVLGHDVVSALLSELNFQTVVHDQASDNYSTVRSRLESRFMSTYVKRGTYPGRLWLDSSRDNDTSFMEEHLEKVVDDPLVKLADYPYWEVHAHKGMYSGKTFPVFVGNKDRDPCIITTPDDTVGLSSIDIIDVPVEHTQAFVIDLPKALRDVAGRGLVSEMTFIQSTELISKAMSRTNLVNKETTVLDFFDEQRLIHVFNTQRLNDEFPSVAWYVHFDIGLTGDATGIAFSAVTATKSVQRHDIATGDAFVEKIPVIVTPAVFRLKNKPGSETPIYKLKNFIFDCKATGIKIMQVSADGYQSANLLQDLRLGGFTTKLVSVDRTKDPYLKLKQAILEETWYCGSHNILFDELKGLKDFDKKIDHIKNKSKDIADACAATVYEAVQGSHSVQSVQDMDDFFNFVNEDQGDTLLYDLIAGSV